jgi:hypothetical protein
MREVVCCLGISTVQSHGVVSALVGGIPPLYLPVKRAEHRSQPGVAFLCLLSLAKQRKVGRQRDELPPKIKPQLFCAQRSANPTDDTAAQCNIR